MELVNLVRVAEFCATLKRVVTPKCFYRLYESDIHCVFAWMSIPTCCVLDAVEACGDETCRCNKLREIAEKLEYF